MLTGSGDLAVMSDCWSAHILKHVSQSTRGTYFWKVLKSAVASHDKCACKSTDNNASCPRKTHSSLIPTIMQASARHQKVDVRKNDGVSILPIHLLCSLCHTGLVLVLVVQHPQVLQVLRVRQELQVAT